MVELWLGIFSCLVRTAFGALLIGYMTQTTTTPPFQDLKTLADGTSYNVLTLNGSLASIIFQLSNDTVYKKIVQKKRFINIDTMEEMYTTICSTKKLNAISQSEDIKKAAGMYICRLNPVGIAVYETWIVSAISWNFSYKRSIDIGILKLYEVGLMTQLKQRWIETKNVEEHTPNVMEPIIMEQVHLILLIFSGGLLISFIILIFENLMFYCSN